MHTLYAAKQRNIIDVTPVGEPAHRAWRQRAANAFSVLLAVVAIPILWIFGVIAALALFGLGALAIAVLPLWARLKR
jgi:hypothetical protein